MLSRDLYRLNFASCCLLLWGASLANAQTVLPDGTLPTQVQLAPNNQGFVIRGGALSGGNLFHSFEIFSPGEHSVQFDLTVGGFEEVERIFSRVTGAEVSRIDGLLQTIGGNQPDLFLLNPQGLVFGPNASLDVGGSFLGTTADSVQFGDGLSFATQTSSSDALLSLSIPMGLQLGQNAGEISLTGPGHGIAVGPPSALQFPFQALPTDYAQGLSLTPGNTLALVGNGLFLDGGTLQTQLGLSSLAPDNTLALLGSSGLAPDGSGMQTQLGPSLVPQGGGQFSLGSGKDGTVALQLHPQWGWILDYGNLASTSDIILKNRTRIDGTGTRPSTIQVSGHNIELTDGSLIYSQNLGGDTNGPIRLEAQGSLFLGGTVSALELPSSIRNSVLAQGNGGALDLRAGHLTLEGGSNITTASFFGSSGDAGAVRLKVEGNLSMTGAVDVQGFSPFGTFIASTTATDGNSGGIDIETGSLTVEAGSLIFSSALFGTGDSNDIQILARDFVLTQGGNPVSGLISGIASSSFAAGNAGSIRIDTPRLRLFERGLVEANIYASGNAGNITVNASESVEIGGRSPFAEGGASYIASTAELTETEVLRQLFQLPPAPSGSAGNVIINTPSLRLFDQGSISTTNEGIGDAGSLEIAANRVSLDESSLTASTLAGDGGNILLKDVDTLTLRNGSLISASAGGQGNGGNIGIDATSIIARPSENSDITANAVGNAGGTITLDTSALLGLKVRPQLSSLSDVTASSGLGASFDGTVEVLKPNTTPDSAVAVLPETVVEPVTRLTRGCNVGETEFHVTGRGGLARSPLDLPELSLVQVELDSQKQFQEKDAKWDDLLSKRLEEVISLRDQGFYSKALAQLEAISLAESLATSDALHYQVLRQLGITYRLLGQQLQAKTVLEQSLVIGKKMDDGLAQDSSLSPAMAATLLSLGHVAKAQDNVEQARHQYLQALELGQGAEVESLIVASLLALDLEQGYGDRAQQWRQQLNGEVNRRPESGAVMAAQLHAVAVQLRALPVSKLSNAATLQRLRGELQRLVTLAQQQHRQSAVAYGLGYLGQVEELLQNWQMAQQYSEKALQFAQVSGDELMAYQWAWQLGRIARHRWEETGDAAWYEQSQGAYQLALESLQSLRSDLLTVAPALQLSFRSGIEPVYREYVDLLLGQPSSMASVQQSEQLQAAINTTEALRLAELDNYLQDACLTARPRSVAEIDGGAAVIYPIILSDRLEVIVTLPQGEMRRYSQPVGQADLAKTVEAFRDGLVWRSQRDFNEPAQQLYQWLVQPIVEELTDEAVETLVFVPDGVLKNVPLSALSDGQEYLIEKFAVAATPSIELLPSLGEASREAETLVAGITQMQQGLAPLPFVSQELSDVQAAIPGQLLLNEQFTRQTLADALGDNDASIVHIATHGQFSSQASETYIQAWNEQISLVQLGDILQARARQGLSPTELLVLSACETALGDEAAALGLAGVAVRAGARSTLASLWSVNDQSTATLMAKFYQQLSQPGMGKAEALRQTQLEMLKDPVYSHPYYWSAFTLLGDWQ